MTDPALFAYMNELLRRTPDTFRRYMHEHIDWRSRLIGITGPRGVGKSTMLLQRLKEQSGDGLQLYVSADHTYFSTHSLVELADDFVKENGRRLYIDEVHKYKGWSRELKQIYDIHTELQIVFTGSSVLDIQQGEADLSRRAVIYGMQGLSFREYLELFHDVRSPVRTLEEILAHKVELPDIPHPLPLFRDYCRSGYYPFAAEGAFEVRMEQVVSQTVESDILQYADMKATTARKLKRMLAIVAQLAPYKPSAEGLSAELGVSRNNVADYLVYLERAEMIGQLRDETGGIRGLGKVEKIYVDNPSLMTVLAGGNPDPGNLRETFFYNQMRVRNEVIASKVSDFAIGPYTFEVGGRKKGRKQIGQLANGIVVRDEIEYGHGAVVPLWHFGFNY